jgi:hypothetical protein
MKKRYVTLLLLIICLVLAFGLKLAYSNNKLTLNEQDLSSCKYTGANLLHKSSALSAKLEQTLKPFGGLNISNFDRSECISPQSFYKNNILVLKYQQVNNSFIGQKIMLYSAYNLQKNTLLLLILDANKQPYLLGDSNKELLRAIQSRSAHDLPIQHVNFMSSKTFADFGISTSNHYLKDWSAIICSNNKFDNIKSCSASQKKITVELNNGAFVIRINGEHYSMAQDAIKIDNYPTVYSYTGNFSQQSRALIAQMATGKTLYYRTFDWTSNSNAEDSIPLQSFGYLLQDMRHQYLTMQ